MSKSIYIIDLEQLKLPRPHTIALLWNQIQKFLDEPISANPRYAELASKLLQDFPTREMLPGRGEDGRDSVWINSPLDQARKITHAVWHMDLPSEQGPQVLARLVQHGTQLGLTLYDDQLGLGFLPDGAVIPSERAHAWEAFQEEAKSGGAPRKAQMRLKMRELFEGRLAAHGFTPDEIPAGTGLDALYRREDADGWQLAVFRVEDNHGSFCCEVNFYGRNFAVRAVHDAAMSTTTAPTDFLSPDYEFWLNGVEWPRHGRFEIGTSQQVAELFDWVLNKAMPLLNRSRTVAGLNWLLNGPEVEFLGRYLRDTEYASLIAARLTNDPCFEERARRFAQIEAEEAQRPNGRPAGRLGRLLAHLRES